MPLEKKKQERVVIEPAGRREINYVTRNDIPCNVSTCEICNSLPEYKPIISQDLPLLLPDLALLERYRHIYQQISEHEIVFLTSILNELKATDELFYNMIVRNIGQNSYLFHDQVCDNTKLLDYVEEEALIRCSDFFALHGANPIIISEYDIPGHEAIRLDEFYSRETHSLLQLEISLDLFLTLKSEELIAGYLPYLDNPADLVAENAVLQGQYRAFKGGSKGFVLHEKLGKIDIPNRYCCNRAMDFDVVYLRLLSKKVEDAEQIIEEGDLAPLQQHIYDHFAQKELEGVVVGIKGRKVDKFCGTLEKPFAFVYNENISISVQEEDEFSVSKVIAVNENLPKFFLRANISLQPYVGERCWFQFESWDQQSNIPSCILLEKLGEVGDRDVEAEVILRERKVRHFDLEQVKEIATELPNARILEHQNYRIDISDELVCSVDPPGCKDIDDALHYVLLTQAKFERRWGRYLLDEKNLGCLSTDLYNTIQRALQGGRLAEYGVHIADVSNYVKVGSAIDLEASKRCTSVYLQDRRIDMLPKLLTEDVCSLVDDRKRFCFSCLILAEEDALLTSRFCKTIVLNKANLSYFEAQALVDVGENAQISRKYGQAGLKLALSVELREMLRFSRLLKQRRLDSGALELESPTAEYALDERGLPVTLSPQEKTQTMSMVEEFMLLANCCAAETMLASYPTCALLRRHPASEPEKFDDLRVKLMKYGLELDTSSGENLSLSLRRISEELQGKPDVLETVKILLTRCMQLAKYFPSGDMTEEDFKHFGLALKYYTHFTSPIRRYSDILVHRILNACIGIDKMPYSLDELRVQCRALNECKEQADRAGRDSDKVFGVLFLLRRSLKEHGRFSTTAEVINFERNRIYLVVKEMGAELDILVGKDATLSPDGLELNWDGRSIQMFSEVRINVDYDAEKPYRFRFKAELI